MTALEQLETTVEGLGLKAVQARLPNLLEQAAQLQPGYADFLLDVLKTEADARRSRYLRARLQLAHLPYVKTFEQFDFSFQPSSTSARSVSCKRCASSMTPATPSFSGHPILIHTAAPR